METAKTSSFFCMLFLAKDVDTKRLLEDFKKAVLETTDVTLVPRTRIHGEGMEVTLAADFCANLVDDPSLGWYIIREQIVNLVLSLRGVLSVGANYITDDHFVWDSNGTVKQYR